MAKWTNKGFPIDKPDADDELYVGIVESLDPQSCINRQNCIKA